jgi:hypothetical protein
VSASALRLRDLLSLVPKVPAVLLEELKYESIGSSPDIEVRGAIKVHVPQNFERPTRKMHGEFQQTLTRRDARRDSLPDTRADDVIIQIMRIIRARGTTVHII